LARAGRTDPEEAAAAASEYLRLFGMTALAYLWARMAEATIYKKDDPDRFYAAKAATARFYFARILPQTGALFAAIIAGGKTITKLEDAAF
jgi:butyryl-CoA dehydrogenase